MQERINLIELIKTQADLSFEKTNNGTEFDNEDVRRYVESIGFIVRGCIRCGIYFEYDRSDKTNGNMNMNLIFLLTQVFGTGLLESIEERWKHRRART